MDIFKKVYNRKDNCMVVKNYDYLGIIEFCEVIFIKRVIFNYVAWMRYNDNRF